MSTSVKVIGLLLLIGMSFVAKKAFDIYQIMDPKPLHQWQASDENSTEVIDHQLWQQILTDNVLLDDNSGINLFNYHGFSAQDRKKLERYLDYMQSLNPRIYNESEQMAYWINLYNAITIQVVVDEYPVKSIKDTGDGLPGLGPWDDIRANVDGEDLTLNKIEHGILRRVWNDNRIHYGVNCASIGCPNLANIAFTGENVDTLLDTMAYQFINHARGVNYDLSNNTLTLSSIFNWFISDFGGDETSLLMDLQNHASPELKAQLVNFKGKVKYQYDWRLNGVKANDQ